MIEVADVFRRIAADYLGSRRVDTPHQRHRGRLNCRTAA